MAKDFFPYDMQSKHSQGTGAKVKSPSSGWMDGQRKKFYESTYTNKPSSGLLGKAAGGALSVFSVYGANKTYGDEYGTGAATLYGLATLNPWLSAAAFVGEVGHSALSYGHQKYHERRRLNFGAPVSDPFGTQATMRQRSLENLSRGRASLGNEARLHHF